MKSILSIFKWLGNFNWKCNVSYHSYSEWEVLSTVLTACLTFAREKPFLLSEIWWAAVTDIQAKLIWFCCGIIMISIFLKLQKHFFSLLPVFHHCLASSGNGEYTFIFYRNQANSVAHSNELCFPLCSQSLVQNSRKAGITSAMASTTLGNEELVSFLSAFSDLSPFNQY